MARTRHGATCTATAAGTLVLFLVFPHAHHYKDDHSQNYKTSHYRADVILQKIDHIIRPLH